MKEGIVISPCPIALVGVGTLFPGSQNPFGFWRDILLERDLITEVPPEYWLVEDYYDPDPRALDKTYAKRGAFFREPVLFDCMEFGILPKNVEQVDVTQLLALWVAKQAFEDATDKDLSKLDRERTGVFVGVSGALEIVTEQSIRVGRPQLVKSLRELGYTEDKIQAIVERFLAHSNVPNEAAFPGGLANVVAGRIANHFDLKGSNCTTDAACASSLAAIKTAMMELWLGEADCCLAGGADTLTGPFPFSCFSKTPALSFSGEIRPFSADTDGTLLGEGICFFVLKRLADAERDGDKIYAVIQGIGSSSDGSGTAIYAPKQEGQILALKRAYTKAGYGPETVELLEAHGTGTRAGDVTEFKAATRVFLEAAPNRKQWCALGSVKSQIGHTKGTAGAASLFKATMALHHQTLPPTLKVTRPNPEFHLEESPFYLNTRTRPWFHVAPYPRRAGVSAFGFGGSNFHVALEEYTGSGNKALRFRPSPMELLLASGQSIEAIHQQVKALLDGRDNDDGFRFACRQSQLAFNVDDPVRLGLVAESSEKALEKLASFIKTIETAPEKDHFLPQMFYAHGRKAGKTAFLFPGQGSQYLYMGSDLAIAFPEARIPWEKARELCLSPEMPLDEIAIPKPAFTEDAIKSQTQRLTETQNAQPAIGLVSDGMLHILKKLGVTADMAAGHSFGELAALYAAGVFSEASFLQAARKRGELMAKAAATPGAMVAVFAPQPDILQLLAALDLPITVANFNAPLQTVLSGDMEAIALLEKELATRKMDFRRLPVATAFHSPLVESAVLPFEEFLKGIDCKKPAFPVYANTTAVPYPQSDHAIKALLAQQLANPVRFMESIEAMHADGARIFIEVGPGQVLSQLSREILKGKDAVVVSLDQKGQHGLSSLWQGLGQLAVSGLAINWPALWEGIAPFDDPRARKKPKIAVELYGYNYNRPYPPKGGAEALPKPNPPEMQQAEGVVKEKKLATESRQWTKTHTAQPNPSNQTAHTTQNQVATPPSQFHSVSQPQTVKMDMPKDNDKSLNSQNSHSVEISPEATPMWLSVIQDMQRQTSETHQQFLQVANRSLQALETAILGQSLETQPLVKQAKLPQETLASSHRAYTTEAKQPSPTVDTTAPKEPAFQAQQPTAIEPQPAEAAPAIDPAPALAKANTAAPTAPTMTSMNSVETMVIKQATQPAAPTMTPEEFLKTLLDVVADKTGYPLDLLEPTMDIETDLGIDSIKRVEILSALQEKIPNLPEVDLTEVAALRTLGEIASYIEQHGSEVAAQASTQAVTPTSTVTQPAASATPTMTPEEFLNILLDVVADKTGYPLDLLEPSMDIETDLGIDSIKRVEILSALQEKIPNLPEVDLTEVAALRTLGEIASYIEQHGSEVAAQASAQANTAAPAAPTMTSMNSVESMVVKQATQPAAPTMAPEEFLKTLLDVVADKTGYPLDLLEPTMDIEADLGIDSIKRVEILSALQEKIPNLPEVDLTEVAALRTLGEIASYIEQHGKQLSESVAEQASAQPAVTPTATVTQPVAPAAPTMTPEEFLNILLDVVADKTGYPLDLLEPTMDIETDLGIDSIKRVEILSALQEKIPNLPEVDLTKVAALRTLGEIASYIEQHGRQLSESVAEQAPTTESPLDSTRKDSGIRRFVVEPTAMPLSTFVLPRLLDQQTVYVTPDTRGVAQTLADALQERGIACAITRDVPQTATIVICLEGLNEPSSIEEALATQQEAFIRLTKLAPTFEKDGGTLVIVQDTAGSFGRSGLVGNRAWLGGLTGLAKTAYLEWPKASVRALDLDTAGKSSKAIVDTLLHEFFYGGSDVEVGVAGDTRVRLGLVQKEIDQTLSPRLGSSDVIVATGGARGVTAACMIELAKATQAKMVLLGRTALEDEPAFCANADDEAALKKAFLDEARARGENITPAMLSKKAAHILGMREIRATLQAIREAGSEVIYENCDVADRESLNMALAKARQAFGDMTAIVHGAGVLADKKLGDKTAEHFQQVFAPKVVGLQNLLQATRDDPIKAMVFFSSVAGRFGNMGQADYAMANEILARVAFAEKRHRPGCLVKSIAWGPWEGGMVSPMLKALFTKFGVAVIPVAEGARRFVEEIQWGDEDTPEVLIGGGEPKISPTSAMGQAPERRFDILIDKARQPYLESHQIAGQIVVPAVMAVEYVLRAGRSLSPHLYPHALFDVKIVRGLTIPPAEFGARAVRLIVRLQEDLEQSGVLQAHMADEGGKLRYAGVIAMEPNPPVAPIITLPELPDLPQKITSAQLYDGQTIFHGPHFYAITQIDGMDDKSICATLIGGAQLHWPKEDWVIDPPLLDGALQAEHLFAKWVSQLFVLPSGSKVIRLYQYGLHPGIAKGVFFATKFSKFGMNGNIHVVDAEGKSIVAIESSEGFAVPSALVNANTPLLASMER